MESVLLDMLFYLAVSESLVAGTRFKFILPGNLFYPPNPQGHIREPWDNFVRISLTANGGYAHDSLSEKYS